MESPHLTIKLLLKNRVDKEMHDLQPSNTAGTQSHTVMDLIQQSSSYSRETATVYCSYMTDQSHITVHSRILLMCVQATISLHVAQYSHNDSEIVCSFSNLSLSIKILMCIQAGERALPISARYPVIYTNDLLFTDK